MLSEEVPDGKAILQDPSRIYNADESGFPLCPKQGKVLAMRGSSVVYHFPNSDKSQLTVLACCSANAIYLPPMIVYQGVRFHYNPLEGFENAVMGRSENGWMDSYLFYTWITETFHPSVQVKRPILLLVDGHSTHINLETSEFCRENGIVLYCLLEHASHIMQPLDLCLFSSLKAQWKQAVHAWQVENPGENVSKKTFATVFKVTWQKSTTVENAVKGFAESGLFPLNADKVMASAKLSLSEIFETAKSEMGREKEESCEIVDDGEVVSENEDRPEEGKSNTTNSITVIADVHQPDEADTALPIPVMAITALSCSSENEVSTCSNPSEDAAVPSAFDQVLTIPVVSASTKRKKQFRPPLPKALTGNEMMKILREKKEQKEREKEEKENRKREREVKKVEREAEKERKKAERERKRKLREQEKAESKRKRVERERS